jgi:hypothetical protein
MNISQMNIKLRLSLWFPFAAASLLTLWVRNTSMTLMGLRFELLAAIGILCVIFAVRILAHTGFRFWPLSGVLFGLVVGQLWFIEFVATMLFWSIRGFAP